MVAAMLIVIKGRFAMSSSLIQRLRWRLVQ
jgi:hypothetical protein